MIGTHGNEDWTEHSCSILVSEKVGGDSICDIISLFADFGNEGCHTCISFDLIRAHLYDNFCPDFSRKRQNNVAIKEIDDGVFVLRVETSV